MKINLLQKFPPVFSRKRPSSQATWRIKDFIDLEYFLKQDAEEKPKTTATGSVSPDRERYLLFAKTHTPPFSRREIIHYWLEGKREAAGKKAGTEARLPGDAFTEVYRLCLSLIIFIALISGVSLAWSVLSYQGHDPINIFTCLWVFLVPQTLLLIFLCIMVLLRRLRLVSPLQSVYPMLTTVLQRWAGRLKTTGANTLPADQQARIVSLYGLMGRQNALYGSIFLWPVFILAQAFMVFFNIGLILAALLKLSITDLAFGWQSTLQPDPAEVHNIIQIISTPWSWLPSASPTIEQIEGSKIILKEGMAHLATTDLVSWWPFLCFALLFYGLLPRLLLLLFGIRQQIRAVNRIDFSSSDCDRLIQKMQTPVMNAEGRSYVTQQAPPPEMLPESKIPAGELNTRDALGKAIVLVPEDIDDWCADNDLEERIADVLGLDVLVRIRCEMTPARDMIEIKNILAENVGSTATTRLIFLQEAWQPPIREIITWIRNLRQTAGKNMGIIVGLVGKPSHGLTFTSPDDTDRVIWEQAINRLADPYIRIENLGG